MSEESKFIETSQSNLTYSPGSVCFKAIFHISLYDYGKRLTGKVLVAASNKVACAFFLHTI